MVTPSLLGAGSPQSLGPTMKITIACAAAAAFAAAALVSAPAAFATPEDDFLQVIAGGGITWPPDKTPQVDRDRPGRLPGLGQRRLVRAGGHRPDECHQLVGLPSRLLHRRCHGGVLPRVRVQSQLTCNHSCGERRAAMRIAMVNATAAVFGTSRSMVSRWPIGRSVRPSSTPAIKYAREWTAANPRPSSSPMVSPRLAGPVRPSGPEHFEGL